MVARERLLILLSVALAPSIARADSLEALGVIFGWTLLGVFVLVTSLFIAIYLAVRPAPEQRERFELVRHVAGSWIATIGSVGGVMYFSCLPYPEQSDGQMLATLLACFFGTPLLFYVVRPRWARRFPVRFRFR